MPPKLRVGRGLVGAGVAGIGTAALVVALSFAFLVCRWAITTSSSFDREYDLKDVLSWLPHTTLICTVFAGCAGWAAFAPPRDYSFPWTLALVAFSSLALGGVIKSFEITPRRYKSIEHPFLYPSEAMILFGVPVAVSAALALFRLRNKQRISTEPIYGLQCQEAWRKRDDPSGHQNED